MSRVLESVPWVDQLLIYTITNNAGHVLSDLVHCENFIELCKSPPPPSVGYQYPGKKMWKFVGSNSFAKCAYFSYSIEAAAIKTFEFCLINKT